MDEDSGMAELSPSQTFRIAIIGSGPSGFYAADHLLKSGLPISIDMFDRLPTPFGLVRGGVAPDHQKIKSVTKVYDKIATSPAFRFFGHVEFGTDLSRDDLQAHYHAVIYAVGAQTDKALGIAGEELSGSHAATEFVAWYNGHPDYKHLSFDLSQERVAVIGVGNVAMDVARILARTQEELAQTDIADYAQAALSQSKVREIYVLGRRGAAQAAFTTPEIKELGEMAGADIVILPEDVVLDDASKAYLASDKADAKDAKNVEIMREYSQRAPSGKPKRIIMRFCSSPVELLGTERVEGMKIVRNRLSLDAQGNVKAQATEQTEILPVGLVFRSVGYKGVALPDVPFDAKQGTIPNDKGRVLLKQGGEVLCGDYVVGWIKRGPSGIIGTNKPDSIETANCLLEDLRAGMVWSPEHPEAHAIEDLLRERGVRSVSYAEWLKLDEIERQRGAEQGRPRHKFTDIASMLQALEAQTQAGD